MGTKERKTSKTTSVSEISRRRKRNEAPVVAVPGRAFGPKSGRRESEMTGEREAELLVRE